MELIWSISRDQVLHTCERRYYFQYLAPARIDSRDPLLREIAFLRKVTNIPMWKGKAFHLVVAEYLQNARCTKSTSARELFKTYQLRLEKQWQSSLDVSAMDLSQQTRVLRENGVVLMEHLYSQVTSQNLPSGMLHELDNFLREFDEWSRSIALKAEITTCSQMWIEPPSYGILATGFQVEGTRVATKVDFAIVDSEGRFIIYDWKTSKPVSQAMSQITQAEFQAAVYQLWPHLQLKKSLESISARLVYFGKEPPVEDNFKIDENLREYTLSLIRRSISRMKDFNQTHYGNVQLSLGATQPLSLGDLDFAHFERSCVYCAFKRICQRELNL